MKLFITVQSGNLAGQRRELHSTGMITVGRDADSNLKFDLNAERLVSKKHAVFSAAPDGFYIIDNNSTNGTYLNGARVSRARLKNGDVVQFGLNGPQVAVTIESAPVQPSASPPTVFAPSTNAPHNNFQPNPSAAKQMTAPFQTSSFSSDNYGEGGKSSEQKSTIGESFANLGLFDPNRMLPKTNATKYIGAAVVLVIGIFLALIISLLTILEIGIIPAVFATIIAFLPAIIYVLPLLWLDRYDPEPPLTLALSFAWGALVAVFISLIVNSLVAELLGTSFSAIVSAPIFEEGTKGLGVVLLLLFRRRDFDGIVDGIVYAGIIALGFATVENVTYYGRVMAEGGLFALVATFFLRGVLSPFAHVIFTSMTGIGCGISRESHNPAVRFATPLIGYVAAMSLHAIWNGMATFGGAFFLLGYVVFEVPFFLIFVGFAAYIMRRENRILKQTLAFEVAKGSINTEQMTIATSAFRSLNWMFAGISQGKFLPRYNFLRAVSKLGLAWWHIQRAQAAQGETRSFGQLPILEKEVLRWRERV